MPDVCLQCSGPIPDPPSGRSGRPRSYCSDRCRVAAHRARKGLSTELKRYAGPADGSSMPALESATPAVLKAYQKPSPFEMQVIGFVIDARRIAAQGDRLGRGPVPQLAARCKATSLGIFEALDKGFPGSDTW